MISIRLTVARRVLIEFRREAIKAFPKEHCSFLIGNDETGISSRGVNIQELWTPDDVRQHATCSRMDFQHHWFEEAASHAKEAGLELIGAVHSHPYPFSELEFNDTPDCSESEVDADYFYWDRINGICLLTQRADLSIRARFRWWGPRTPVQLIAKEKTG